MKNFPTPQYRKPARWWSWKCKTLRQQNSPPPLGGRRLITNAPHLDACDHAILLSQFVSSLFSKKEKKKKGKPDRFSFCSSRRQRIWIRLSRLKPTDLQFSLRAFSRQSWLLRFCTWLARSFFLELRVFWFRTKPDACFFFIWGHFLSLLIGCSYCVVHNRICIVIIKYVISKAFG